MIITTNYLLSPFFNLEGQFSIFPKIQSVGEKRTQLNSSSRSTFIKEFYQQYISLTGEKIFLKRWKKAEMQCLYEHPWK